MQVKGQRKISFDQFVRALGIIAEKRGEPLKQVVHLVLQAKQPSVTGTKAGFVKFHDDKVASFPYVPFFSFVFVFPPLVLFTLAKSCSRAGNAC